MTHSGGQPHTNVGDRGQRYEVTVYDGTLGKRIVIGWSDDHAGALKMAIASELRPSWMFARVREREVKV